MLLPSSVLAAAYAYVILCIYVLFFPNSFCGLVTVLFHCCNTSCNSSSLTAFTDRSPAFSIFLYRYPSTNQVRRHKEKQMTHVSTLSVSYFHYKLFRCISFDSHNPCCRLVHCPRHSEFCFSNPYPCHECKCEFCRHCVKCLFLVKVPY